MQCLYSSLRYPNIDEVVMAQFHSQLLVPRNESSGRYSWSSLIDACCGLVRRAILYRRPLPHLGRRLWSPCCNLNNLLHILPISVECLITKLNCSGGIRHRSLVITKMLDLIIFCTILLLADSKLIGL